MLELPNISLGYDPEQDLRRWAIEKACEVYWEGDGEKTIKLANLFLNFVKGETE